MKYPTLPGLAAPRSAWNRLLAPLFDVVERANRGRKSPQSVPLTPPAPLLGFRAEAEPDENDGFIVAADHAGQRAG
jgi:hypothetical protein